MKRERDGEREEERTNVKKFTVSIFNRPFETVSNDEFRYTYAEDLLYSRVCMYDFVHI